ncbi:cyclic di-GMP phosphodiesterase [Maricurvus nonylphenolicus]|uniref:HD-GYP domain-containing protein n=1 Tax=Maricurvus nonylphenolicus TaxID=1008307 RepID=UPI0036F27ADA
MKKTRTHSGHFAKEQTQKKIHISEVGIGMFVSKLDRDWLETPFLMQGFVVENQDDIEVLAEYCEYVWIDAVQDTWVPPEEHAVTGSTPKQKRYINKISSQQEHRQAIGVYREARKITKSLLEEARLGGAIDTEHAKATVHDCVNSILRNADALMWMGRMRNEDEYTAEHCLNVCILAISFGRHLGMAEEDLHKIGLCGLLHDVGKMRVPPAVLNKPGKLTEKEFKMMKAHTVHGRNLLMSSPGAYHGTVDVAYSHHERLDGTGYPRKLKAAGISEFSRMIAIVDAYDAMTAERCYAPAMPTTEAIKIIYHNRGTQFDGRLADQFIEMIGLYPPGSIVELNNGMVGIVLNTNYRYRHLPKVILVRDSNKKPVREKIVNLAETEKGNLEHDFLIQRVLVDGSYNVRLKDYREKGLQLSFG